MDQQSLLGARTREYEKQSLQIERSYKLGYALVNKISIYGRMKNQIISLVGLVHQGLGKSIEHGNLQIVETYRGFFFKNNFKYFALILHDHHIFENENF
jgi:hypothetical protein